MMKKIGFLLASMMLFSAFFDYALAQESKFGFHGGVNISRLKFDDYSNNSRVANVLGGLYYGYEFNELLGVQAGLDFTLTGTEESSRQFDPETGESYDWNFEMSFDNWRIPIVFTVSPTEWLRFNVGPQLSFCSKGEVFDTKAQEYGGQVRYKLSRKEYNVFDIQAVAGVDFRFYQRFVLGLRYVYGFRNVLKDNFGMDYEIMNAGKSYHRAATITFGLEF